MIRWQRIHFDDPFEYAIQQGTHGDEFVKLLDGSCLRRKPDEFHDEMRLTIEAGLGILANVESRLPSEILWKILARDLLTRIDRAVPQRVAPPSLDHVRPSNGIERDDADLDWAS